MKAVILAAGKGGRLEPFTKNTPKCLVKVRGRPIIDYLLEGLAEAGIDDIAIVVGYLADKIKNHFRGKYRIFLNKDYATTNSMYSLWLMKDELIDRNFILFNSDLIFSKRLLKRVVDFDKKTASLVDNTKELKDGEMNVTIKEGAISEISKEIKAKDASAESAQITKFSARDSAILFRRIEQIISSGDRGRFPADAYEAIIEESNLYPVFTQGLDWIEIDSISDMDHALDNVHNAFDEYFKINI